MFERAGESAFDYRLHGGAEPTRIQWYFHERTQLPVAVQSWTLPPGGGEGAHAHGPDQPLEELYVVLEGSAAMRVDGVEHTLGPGDAVLATVGSDHDLRNTGSVPLTVMVIWGRPGEADWSAYGTAAAASAARTTQGS
ncbi:MAG: cupin domain-containing protein [Actinomycetes bacterium]